MTRITREQLSAFVDGELDDLEAELLVRRLSTDSDLRGAAVRYALIGDAVRGELLSGDPRELPRRVARATGGDEERPAVQTPSRSSASRGLARPLAGAAVAASVAVLAILAVSTTDRNVGPDEVTVPDPATVSVTPVAGTPTPIARAGSPTQLSRYYLNHSQYATTLGGQGSLIRIVRAPESPAEDQARAEQDKEDAAE